MATVTVTGGFVVASGETRSFTNESAFLLQPSTASPPDTLVIRGTVEVLQTADVSLNGLIGVSADFFFRPPANAVVTIDRSGILQVLSARSESFGNSAYAFYGSALDVDFVNNGSVVVRTAGAAYGAFSSATAGWEFRNTYSFSVTSTGGEARGVISVGVFNNSGLFVISGKTQVVAVDVTRFPAATFYNSGTIQAINTDATIDSIGVLWRSGSYGDTPFINDGRIEAELAIKSSSPPMMNSGPETFINRGTIVGRIEIGDAGVRLVNTGLIQGDITLGGNADYYDGSAGRLAGNISAGGGADTILAGAGPNYLRGDDGNDSISGGANFDDINGNVGADTASGGAGDDWVVGGKDNDRLSGDAGGDLVYGNLGNDTCDGGAGNDIVRGGQDDDLCLGGDGDDYVSGDKGSDTMTGGLGADVFHSFGDAGLDRVTDFSLAQGDRVQLDPGTQYTVSQSGADTVINMTGGGQMILVGVQMSTLTPGWIFGA